MTLLELQPFEADTPSPPPRLVPVLSLGQEAVLRVLALLWTVAAAAFWVWWLSPARGGWSTGRVGASLGLAWVSGLGGYFTFFACRMTKPDVTAPVPVLRVAMVVTKAPSEPWPVVQQTLEAMLDQDLPYAYDVWIADERPTFDSLLWCFHHGVQVSSREGQDAYHQSSWPRRTRCKEGNLAWFYDTVGYDSYDVVSQLDADHVPDRDYLAQVVRPFADPKVGYVSAPSICDANASAGWTVRGRLHKEASLHGPSQAGCNDGWSPMNIGSHYAVRTVALKDVGGIGPDLAEDYSTTLWMQAAGWDGVFALDAIAHGDGPESLRDMITQEIQWSRSLGTILTRWAPAKFAHLHGRVAIRMGFPLLFYPLQSLFCVLGTLLPVYGVVTRAAWGNSTLGDFYVHLWAVSIVLMTMLWWLRRCQVLRPASAPLWSWELVLFQLVRWPFVAWSFVQGMVAGIRRSDKPFRVTPKGAQDRPQLSVSLLWPTAVLAALPGVVVVAVDAPGQVLGLWLLLGMQALTYGVALLALVVLQVRAVAASLGPASGSRHGRRAFAVAAVSRLELLAGCWALACVAAVVVRVAQL